MPRDQFRDYKNSLSSPLTRLETITPSDTTDLQSVTRAINVAVSGTVNITTLHGTTGVVTVNAGVPFPIRVTRVWETGTTATGIVGLA